MKKQILLLPLFVTVLCLSARAASFAYVNTEDILQSSKEFKVCEK